MEHVIRSRNSKQVANGRRPSGEGQGPTGLYGLHGKAREKGEGRAVMAGRRLEDRSGEMQTPRDSEEKFDEQEGGAMAGIWRERI